MVVIYEELKWWYKTNGLCQKCDQPKTDQGWCWTCNAKNLQENFKNWTSGNSIVDNFIQDRQLKAVNHQQVLEWIPYEKFTNISDKPIGKGGFGEVYKAEMDGKHISGWSESEKKHKLWKHPVSIALKVLYNSRNITKDFLQEVANHVLATNSTNTSVVRCYGISQNPETKNYIMVMKYIESGNLGEYLQNNYSKLRFKQKLNSLLDISRGLNAIHKQKLIHRDLHMGNILNSIYIQFYITDLGLCRPADEVDDSKVYGVLSHIAPEVLRGKEYTQSSDIYAFGMIAYETLSGKPPYHDLPHDGYLGQKIMQGLRPNLKDMIAPQLLRNLIKKCWDADPLKRPTVSDLNGSLLQWEEEIGKEESTEFFQQVQEIKRLSQYLLTDFSYQIHPQTVYCSRLLDFKNLSEPQNSKEINEKFWSSQHEEFPMTELQEELERTKINSNQFSQPIEFTTAELSQINWEEIMGKSTNDELINQWQSLGFTPSQTQDWLSIGLQPHEHHFASYLRSKHLTPEEVLNQVNYEQMKQEFLVYQQTRQEQPPKS